MRNPIKSKHEVRVGLILSADPNPLLGGVDTDSNHPSAFADRYHSLPTGLVGGYLPRRSIAEPPLDVPAFMKKTNDVQPPYAKRGQQSFKEIMAEAERILRS